MKTFLEIIETVESEEAETKTVKIEVRDKAEAQSKIANAEKEFVGKKYVARLHTCNHGNHGKNQPCEVEILKEVNEQK